MSIKRQRKHILINRENSRSPMAEAYRTLRTNLKFTEIDKSCRSILVSSASPMDGKSTTAANLALVMAQTGKKVILVDCDLRKPSVDQIFKLQNHFGMTNYLSGSADIDELIHEDAAENLSILCSGPIPPNPSEILGSVKMSSLWSELCEKYDYVIIDSPPVLAVSDASILSAQVDGVLLVIRSAVTRIDMAQQAKEQLSRSNAYLMGVVLNHVHSKKGSHYYYYGSA